jgi:hypothetical protein
MSHASFAISHLETLLNSLVENERKMELGALLLKMLATFSSLDHTNVQSIQRLKLNSHTNFPKSII